MLELKTIIYGGLISIATLITTSVSFYYIGKTAGFDAGQNHVEKQLLEKNIVDLRQQTIDLVENQKIFNDGVAKLNKELSEHAQTVKIINTNTEKELEKIVYRDTIIPSTGVQLIADNAKALNANRISRSAVGKVPSDSTNSK